MLTPQAVTFVFQDPAGNPLDSGRVDICLQQDISSGLTGGPQIAAGRLVSVNLDSSGSATVDLWPTVGMSPSSIYFVQAFSSSGQPVWKGQITVG